MMDLNNECKGGDGFIDRSKVRILLCDSDAKSLKEVFTLLSECSYQVTSVKSARQVIDALNAEGPDIDIILAEIDLPMAKGMKMLRYITRDKDLRRIPVIMMSRQDEVAVVVKCLKLGAADYLVKPLRSNELLNLWTHMWRRRRMLGLAEKNMLSYDFDLVGSDPSDPNTNSTNLFSDDTDERSHRCTHLQRGTLNHQENEWSVATAGDGGFGTEGTATSTPTVPAPIEPPPLSHLTSSNLEPMKRYSNSVQFSSTPKQSKLKIGESSAFFTYVKSTVLRANCQEPPQANENGSLHRGMVEKLQVVNEGINNTKQANGIKETRRNYSQGDNLQNGTKYADSLERSCITPTSMELHGRNYQENMNSARIVTSQSKDSSQADGSGFSAQNAYPYYMQGVMNQVMMQSAAHAHASLAMMPQYGHHLPHCPPNHPNGISGFPYYHHHHPMNTSLQHNQMSSQHHQNGQMSIQNGQMSTPNGQMSLQNGQMAIQNGQMAIQNGQMSLQNGQMSIQNGQMSIQNSQMSLQNGQMSMVHHSWSPAGNFSSNEVKMTKLDRREEALLKFRRKRNQRCFDKKIRYVNRKRLAERRPRVRGQFVRKMNGVNVDLNGQPDSADYDDEEEEEEEEEERDSSPQDDALGT